MPTTLHPRYSLIEIYDEISLDRRQRDTGWGVAVGVLLIVELWRHFAAARLFASLSWKIACCS